MSNESGPFAQLIKWLVVGFLAIIAIRIAFAVVGAAFHISVALLFKLGPILLVGWLILRLLRRLSKPKYAEV